MKFSTAHAPASITNIVSTSKSKIIQTGAMFDLLSTRLYTRPMEAAIRETLKNALDAHIDNKTTRPVEITSPSREDPHLIIRDFGKGLSAEQVESNFINYGDTSKDDSPDQHGGMGIGSKAPFSITDQFSIITRHGGTETTYIFFRQPGQGPEIAQANSVPLDPETPTGLEVIIPINPEERYTVSWKIETLLKAFPLGFATVDGVPFTPPVPVYSNQFGYLVSSGSNIQVQCGPVIYSYDMPEALFGGLRSIVLTLPATDVTISPSRESLIADEKTSTAVLSHCKAFLDQLPLEFVPAVSSRLPANEESRVDYVPQSKPGFSVVNGSVTVELLQKYLDDFKSRLVMAPKDKILGYFLVCDLKTLKHPKMQRDNVKDCYLFSSVVVVYNDLYQKTTTPRYLRRILDNVALDDDHTRVLIVSDPTIPHDYVLSEMYIDPPVRTNRSGKMKNFKIYRCRDTKNRERNKDWYRAPDHFVVQSHMLIMGECQFQDLKKLSDWDIDYDHVLISAKNPLNLQTVDEHITQRITDLLSDPQSALQMSRYYTLYYVFDQQQRDFNQLLQKINHPLAIPDTRKHERFDPVLASKRITPFDISAFEQFYADQPLLRQAAKDFTHPDVIRKLMS